MADFRGKVSLSRWRRFHRRLALFVGIQVLLWCLSGAYMVWMSLDFIRGDGLVRHLDKTVAVPPMSRLQQLMQTYPNATGIQVRPLHPGTDAPTVIVLTTATASLLLDATSLSPITIDASLIEQVARAYNAREGLRIEHVRYVTEHAPQEVASRKLPLWQVKLSDAWQTHLYFSGDTASLVAKRHDYWRIFDVFWMLHIMDYEDRSDVQNNVLRTFALASLLFTVIGMIILWQTARHAAVRRR